MATRILLVSAVLSLALAALVIAAADKDAAVKWAKPADLGGQDRYLTSIDMDKPIYSPGDRLFVRAVVLHSDNHTPLPPKQNQNGRVEVVGPKGDTVAGGFVNAQDSVAGFAWDIPRGQPGGQYTVKVKWFTGWAPAQRKFDIRAFRAPRLRSQIVFVREGYGAGDRVSVSLHAERAEGGIPTNAKVTAVARVDDAEAWRGTTKVDAHGNCSVAFDLPKEIARGEGTMAFIVEDGGTVETAAKTIPILLQSVDLAAYPEGGDLVAGLPSRVYVEARTPAQKPADIAGVVVDEAGKEVARFRTEHEGRGRFSFTPGSGRYTLRITEPATVKTTLVLPVAKTTGAIIESRQDVTPSGKPVRLTITTIGLDQVKVTLTKREAVVASQVVAFESTNDAGHSGAAARYAKLKLDAKDADGVLIATVWDANDQPLVERLVYRQPAHSLRIRVQPDQTSYIPGGQATLKVTTTDEDGNPVPAVVGLTVTDDSMLEMIEKREQAPRLPVMVLLEDDVRELADAHVYLDPKNPKAPLATDLLLGTQGWRRFAFLHVKDFLAKQGEAAKRVLAFHEPARPMAGGGGAGWGGGLALADGPVLRQAAAVPLPAAAPQAARPVAPVDVKRAAAEPMMPEQAAAKKQAFVIAGPVVAGQMQARRRDAAFEAETVMVRNDMIPVREYAFRVNPNRQPNDRTDFTQTIYWNAAVKTDAKGQASVSFGLCDSVTTFRVNADAFDTRGAMGAATPTVSSIQPFYLEAKVPLEVTVGDVIDVPVVVVNNTAREINGGVLQVQLGPGLDMGPSDADRVPSDTPAHPFKLAPGQSLRRMVNIRVAKNASPGSIFMAFDAEGGGFADHITRPLAVKPLGFPTSIHFGGVLQKDSTLSRDIIIPDSLTPGSMHTSIAVYPTPLANLTQALQALLREPGGCFEQTSSTSYPLTMAQLYFTTHSGVDPALIQHANELMDHSYKHLVGFECSAKGYEWFGGSAPGHEALTAYGLMQFHDMQTAQLSIVDGAMVQRTSAWLLSRRDGHGGFERNQRALDSFGGAPADTTNAYIVWALLEAGQKDLGKETDAAKQAAEASSDSYVIALGANVALDSGDTQVAKALMTKLAARQDKSGAVTGAVTTITRSGGEALAIETTSLSLLAWLHEPAFAGNVEEAVRYLAACCQAGRFASTQATILALKAVTAYDRARAHPRAPGKVQLIVDDKPVGDAVAFDAQTQDAIKLPDVAGGFGPGKHLLSIHMEGGADMPYAVELGFNSVTPATPENCPVTVQVSLGNKTVEEGAVTEARVEVTNASGKDAPTPVAIIGIPGGLEVRHDQLKELVKAGRIDAYEVIGRDAVLYWRQIKAVAKVELPLSLVAAVPGAYTGPASRAYEYYTDELKQWVEGVSVTITAKGK